jgi:uncharacterized protein (DUF2141 family)
MNGSRRPARGLPCLFLLALLTSLPTVSAQTQPATRVQIVVSGLRNAKGQVSCALFRSADGFPKDAKKAVAHQEVRIGFGVVRGAHTPAASPVDFKLHHYLHYL